MFLMFVESHPVNALYSYLEARRLKRKLTKQGYAVRLVFAGFPEDIEQDQL